VHLALQRNINLYLQQLYLPSTLIVALSFIAFWIDYKSHPARTLLSLLSIVTVTTKAEGILTSIQITILSSSVFFSLHMRAAFHLLALPCVLYVCVCAYFMYYTLSN